MEGPPLGPGGEDITWPNQVAPRGRKASSTRKIKPQTSNLIQTLSIVGSFLFSHAKTDTKWGTPVLKCSHRSALENFKLAVQLA